MPVIPAQTAPTVQPGAAPGVFQRVDARPEAFGALEAQAGQQLGRAGQQLAEAMADNAFRLAERQAEAAAKDADIEATRRLAALEYDPQSGYLTQLGRNAVQGYEPAVSRANEIQAEVLQGLDNPRARELAAAVIARRVEATKVSMARHAAGENRKWLITTSDTRAVTEIEAASLDYVNDQRFAQAVGTARDEARQQGELQGWDEATTRLKAQQYTEQAWKARLMRWRMNDPVGALAAFQRNATSMDPAFAATLGHTLYAAAAPVLAAQLNDVGGPAIPASDAVPAPAKEGEALPRGVRNNNPGNIQKSAIAWEGKVEGHDPRYESFATPEAGIRALATNLRTYQERHGLDTVEGIVSRWAPATENATAEYVRAVSAELGVEPGTRLNLADPKLMTGLVKAIVRQENGQQPYTDEQIAAGVAGRLPKRQVRDFSEVGPAEAATLLTGNPVVDALPPDWKLHVINTARTQSRQDQSQLRERLKYRVTDDLAAYERGATPPNPVSGSEIMLAYGQEEGARVMERLDAAQRFGQDVNEVATLPASQQAELLARRAPQPGEGFAEAARRHEQLVKAVESVQRAREQDPATFVLQNAPAVMQAYRAMAAAKEPAERAQAAQAYAAAVLAEQQRLEVRDPTILPKNYVAEIARRFYQPSSKEGEDAGVDPGSVMSGLVAEWGRFWPVVGKQLAKALPPGAVVLGLGVQPEAEQLIGEAMRLKPEQLRQGFETTEVTDLRAQVRSTFEPLAQTLAFQGGGTETYDAYADTAEALALMLMRRGMSAKEAAAKAWESTVGFKYEFQDTWRVPRAVLGGGASLQAIRDGAAMARFDVAEAGELAVPRVPAAVRPEDAARQWAETIKENGFWITSPGDGGLTLYVRSGLGAQPVLDKSGRPVRRGWDELAGAGSSVKAAFPGDVWTPDRVRGGKGTTPRR